MTTTPSEKTIDPSTSTETRACQVHGEYTAKLFRMTSSGPWMGGSCPRCAEEREAAQARRKAQEEERQRQDKIERGIQRAGIPARFKDRTIKNYQVTDPGEDKAKKIASWFIETWSERLANGTSLIFCGLPGTGKTHLACAIGNQLLQQGVSVMFTTVSDAMRRIKSTYDKDSTMSEAKAIEIYTMPRLLILDEIQVQTGSDHEMKLMFEIINRRYENVLPTIVLSNMIGQSLKDYLGDRIIDRLREGGGKYIEFNWKSRRA